MKLKYCGKGLAFISDGVATALLITGVDAEVQGAVASKQNSSSGHFGDAQTDESF